MDVQDLFDRMMLLDNQLGLASGGDDVSRGITALNMAIDYLEGRAAKVEGVLTTDDLLYTSANTERTQWPVRLLRLDDLWFVDEDTNRQLWRIEPLQGIGKHTPGFSWPLSELVMTGVSPSHAGKPKEFGASGPGGQFYWAPTPDDEYWIRGYGLWSAVDLVDADDTFPYVDTVALPVASFATYLFRLGLDRDLVAIENLAARTFDDVLKGLSKYMPTEPQSRVYTEVHDA